MLFYPVIFLSAFLLFLVQPLIAKQILPWFGGSAAVWTTCMVFFQTVLLLGYSYADLMPRQVNWRKQLMLHLGLLLLSLIFMPIVASNMWQPSGSDVPILKILAMLAVTIGMPYALLSTTSPLMQQWFNARFPGRDPYRLFAVSNTASLLALLSYPFVFEPLLGLKMQAYLWSALYALWVVFVGVLAWQLKTTEHISDEQAAMPTAAPTLSVQLKWLALSATGSILLLAVSNHLTQNIAGVPLLWLAPLAIYLITFILTFDGRGWYLRPYYFFLLFIALGGMSWLLVDASHRFDLYLHIGIFSLGLFLACMYCHGELVAAKPEPAHLGRFYTLVSVGGALGAVLVGLMAPVLLPAFFEMPIVIVVLAALSLVAARTVHHLAPMLSVFAICLTVASLGYQIKHEWNDTIAMTRNFYGVVKVKEYGTAEEKNQSRRLVHGAIMHGEQFLDERWKRSSTTYYTETSGVGLALSDLQQRFDRGLKVGMVGLGTGTIATYGRMGDLYRFYEIDPAILKVANEYFSFMKDSRAKVEVAMGDARLSLMREAPNEFDLLAIDAFSGDAIPAHLLTKEVMEIYLKHLAKEGILAVHVSNRFLDLTPVVGQLADQFGMTAGVLYGTNYEKGSDGNPFQTSSTWVLLGRTPEVLSKIAELRIVERKDWRLWTDDYTNLVQVLKKEN